MARLGDKRDGEQQQPKQREARRANAGQVGQDAYEPPYTVATGRPCWGPARTRDQGH